MRLKMLAIILVATTMTVSGCKRAATGQVVAVVNGQEISLSELNAELQNAPAGGDKQAIRAAALQNVINRKLLVQQAHDRGIDKDPEFLARQRRMNDGLMVAMLGEQVTKNIAVPSASDIDRFIAQHPEMFAQRTIYPADQIIFQQPQDFNQVKALEADHSLQAVADRLTGQSIPFERQKSTIDTAALAPELLKQIIALPPGEPFVLSTGGRIVVTVIGDKTVQPIAGDQARKLAVDAIRRTEIKDLAERQLKQARDAAKIEYQTGFAPSKGSGKLAGQ